MSLHIYLSRKMWISYDEGKTWDEGWEELYTANITHNLGEMAEAAGIYEALWEPEKIGATKAGDIIDIIKKGLAKLKRRPQHFMKFNSSNGWGLYENFVPFVEKYLAACKEHPEATIEVSV